MADREFLERMDQRLARGNELLGEVKDEMRLNREERAESREFIREIVGRIERGSREEVRVLQGLTDEIRDLIAESRAQREALLRMLDRLGPGPEPA